MAARRRSVERAGYLTDLLAERAVGVLERAARQRVAFYRVPGPQM